MGASLSTSISYIYSSLRIMLVHIFVSNLMLSIIHIMIQGTSVHFLFWIGLGGHYQFVGYNWYSAITVYRIKQCLWWLPFKEILDICIICYNTLFFKIRKWSDNGKLVYSNAICWLKNSYKHNNFVIITILNLLFSNKDR